MYRRETRVNYGLYKDKPKIINITKVTKSRSLGTEPRLQFSPFFISRLPPSKSFRIASDDPVPAEDYNNLRNDYFLLRLSYEILLDNLDKSGIIRLVDE